jgi:3-deoxy-D-manno-octulosonic-acid transferase
MQGRGLADPDDRKTKSIVILRQRPQSLAGKGLTPIYTALIYLFAPIALGLTALRGLRDSLYRDRLGERLGYARCRFDSAHVWVHAVSVGEVQAAAALVRALRARYPDRPILVTTSTPTGAQRVQALFGESVQHSYLPYDLPGAVRRFLDRVRPQIGIVMEREIWPNLFRECARRRIPLLLASARLSQPSAQRQRRWSALFRPALVGNVTVAAQTAEDARRYEAIGADAARTHITGNIKFDIEVPAEVVGAGAALRTALGDGRAVWVAGSTHEREEDMVLDAHRRVLARRGDALLVLVPRHPNRFGQVKAWLDARGVPHVSRSSGEAVTPAHSVLLVDALGELLQFYAAGDVAFVGGSLVPIGGHNLLEPAALSRPILTGPHTFNGPEIARMLTQSGAAVEVSSAEALAAALGELLADARRRDEMGAAGRAVVQLNRGALARIMRLVDDLLGAGSQTGGGKQRL